MTFNIPIPIFEFTIIAVPETLILCIMLYAFGVYHAYRIGKLLAVDDLDSKMSILFSMIWPMYLIVIPSEIEALKIDLKYSKIRINDLKEQVKKK